MQIYREHFGKKLKEAIKNLPTSQSKLAEALEVEPPTVSRWVNAVDFPNEKHMEKICEFLNVDPSYFGMDQTELSALQFIDYLFENKDLVSSLRKIPKDVLIMLSHQDETYFSSLRRILEGLEKKRNKSFKRAT